MIVVPHRPLARSALSYVVFCIALGSASAACPDDQDLLKRSRGGSRERAARRAGGPSGAEPDLAGLPRPLGGGAVARLLVRSVEETPRRTTHLWTLYVDKVERVRAVRRALLSARPATFGTCPPTWRLDLRFGADEHVAFVSVPCRRLVLDGRELDYDDGTRNVIEPILRLASRKPSHKIFPVKVPVEHDPQLVLGLLGARSLEALLPERPARRGPVARMTYSVQERPPSDPGQLDRAVATLRRRAYDKLDAYALQLRTGRREILDVIGPLPVFERFGDRLFEARYVLTVLFRHGTPEYMLGFLGLGSDLVVEKITIPTSYRVDLLFPTETSVNEMKKALEGLSLVPPISRF